MSKLRAGAPLTVAGITLIPIERLRIDAVRQPQAYWFNASKDAVAVVICSTEGMRVVDVEANERSIDEFITAIPGLASLLAARFPR